MNRPRRNASVELQPIPKRGIPTKRQGQVSRRTEVPSFLGSGASGAWSLFARSAAGKGRTQKQVTTLLQTSVDSPAPFFLCSRQSQRCWLLRCFFPLQSALNAVYGLTKLSGPLLLPNKFILKDSLRWRKNASRPPAQLGPKRRGSVHRCRAQLI